MDVQTMQLIKLINENRTLNEITTIMNLSKKQLFDKMTSLRNSGYLIDKKYYYNGDIKYCFENPFKTTKKLNELTIENNLDIQEIKLLLTSDSHFGHKQECLEMMYNTFEYCDKEKINLILHAGDFFEGVVPNSKHKQKYNSIEEQIYETIEKYPLVDNILTITCLGNHDASFILDAGIDIKTILENTRHDIIPVGYGQGRVNILDNRFILNHQIDRVNMNYTQYNKVIFLNGHSHSFYTKFSKDSLSINIPSSSCLGGPIFLGIPSILELRLKVTPEKNQIINGNIKHLMLINNKLVKVGEQNINYKIGIPKIDKPIKELHPKMYTCFTNDDLKSNLNTSNINEELKNIDLSLPTVIKEKSISKDILIATQSSIQNNKQNLSIKEKIIEIINPFSKKNSKVKKLKKNNNK